MSESHKKRRDLSLKEKLDILDQYSKLPKMSQRNAASQLKISQPLLCKILKNKVFILELAKHENINCKRNRSGKDPQVESALKLWFENQKDAKLDGPLMRQKAEDFAKEIGKEDFKATDGWFNRWKKRENIVYKKTCSEKEDADFIGADNWLLNEWPNILAEFSASCVYNAGETGLYYRALPQRTYLFKNENPSGCKICKERITVLCCVNMAGSKEKLLIIGKSKNPHSFQGIKKLPVEYHANSNARMTSKIFDDWLTKWDNNLKHNIVLLVDNCAAYKDITTTLKHIKVIYLPGNSISLNQPCDLGIIKNLKAFYRQELKRFTEMRARIIESTDKFQTLTSNELAKKTTLLDAIHLVAASWNQVSEKTVENCFRKGGFLIGENEDQATFEDETEDDLNPTDLSLREYAHWMDVDDNIKVEAEMTEDKICEAVASTSKVAKEENIDDDENDEYVPQRSKQEVQQALEILRQFVQQNAEDFQKHYEYEQFINNILREDSEKQLFEKI